MGWLHAAVASFALLQPAGPPPGQPILLDFYSDSCGPCRAMIPAVQGLIDKGYLVRKINVEHDRAAAQQFGVTSIPCFVLVADGREVDRVVGSTTYSRLERMFKLAASQAMLAGGPGATGGPGAPGGPGATGSASAEPRMITPPPGATGSASAEPRMITPPPGARPLAAAPSRGAPTSDPFAWTPGPDLPPTTPAPGLAPRGGYPSGPPRTTFATDESLVRPAAAVVPVKPSPATTPAWPGGGAPVAGMQPLDLSPARVDDPMVAASVRIRVSDSRGVSKGSGTIVFAQNGEAIVVTCGHIFRDSQGRGLIEVDVFGPTPAERLRAQLIAYDEHAEIGLLRMRVPGPVAVARVAPPDYRVGQGDPVVSVGCDNGANPSAIRTKITGLNRLVGRPANLHAAGAPVEGRSGGGLFTETGLLVGICFAASPTDQQGLYTAAPALHGYLDNAGLSYVYQAPAAAALADSRPARAGDAPSMPRRMPGTVDAVARGGLSVTPVSTGAAGAALSPQEQAAIEEIRKRLQDGAEVVCVVHNRKDPTARSEVIVLNQVSAEFLAQLVAETRPQDTRPARPAAPARPLTPPTAPRGGIEWNR